jgi:hypothetical protein
MAHPIEQAAVDFRNSFSDLNSKFSAYTKASTYDGKKDYRKWVADLIKVSKEVVAAVGATIGKLAIFENVVKDYAKKHDAAIKNDKKQQQLMTDIAQEIKSTRIILLAALQHMEKRLTQLTP